MNEKSSKTLTSSISLDGIHVSSTIKSTIVLG